MQHTQAGGNISLSPEASSTEYANNLLRKYANDILSGDGVVVPDDEEEMNWRLFFAHSQDMQGFAADVFTGGPNERSITGFEGLRRRWSGDSPSLLKDLACLWERSQKEFKKWSHPHKSAGMTAQGVKPLLDLLVNSGLKGAVVFGKALEDLRGPRIARKTRSWFSRCC